MGSVLVLEPGECYSIVDVGTKLDAMTLCKLIDGTVSVALRVEGKSFNKFIPNALTTNNAILFCDDDGHEKGLPPTIRRPTDGWMLVGAVVIARYESTIYKNEPNESYYSLTESQLHEIVSYLKSCGWSHLILDEIDYTKPFIMSGGKVGEA